jgi:hypothetical protein
MPYVWNSTDLRYECTDCGQGFSEEYQADSHTEYGWCDECDSYVCTTHSMNGTHDCYSTASRTAAPSAHESPLSYSYKPVPEFRGNGWHVGLELEVSASSGYGANVAPIYEWARNQPQGAGLFYCKEDSSVRGFEIVTHPMSPEFFRSFDWEGFFDMLNRTYPTPRRRSGETESREHGLHVHVERSAFSRRVELARWSYLINRCPADTWQRIARRNPSSWGGQSQNPVTGMLAMRYPNYLTQKNRWRLREPAKPTTIRWPREHRPNIHLTNPNASMFACVCGNDYCNEFDERFREGDRRLRDYRRAYQAWQSGIVPFTWSSLPRYSAINHAPDATCEVRSFRSTRDPFTLRQSVGTVVASVDYATDMQQWHKGSSYMSLVNWDAFADWCRTHETHSEVYATVAGMTIPSENNGEDN